MNNTIRHFKIILDDTGGLDHYIKWYIGEKVFIIAPRAFGNLRSEYYTAIQKIEGNRSYNFYTL